MPSAMPAILADVSRARRIPAATAGTIMLQAASSATCEGARVAAGIPAEITIDPDLLGEDPKKFGK